MNITKISVITGASRGLGLITANMFADRGWDVIGIGTSPRPADLQETIEYYQFDASNIADCDAFWRDLKKKAPEVPITLVNNAGGYISGRLQELELEAYRKQMNANFFSAVNMTHTLIKIAESARIITIISDTAHQPTTRNTAYGASKAAEKYFLQTLQKELKPTQFKITNIYPDAIATKGDDPNAINPKDLADFICNAAEFESTYYIRDITLTTDA